MDKKIERYSELDGIDVGPEFLGDLLGDGIVSWRHPITGSAMVLYELHDLGIEPICPRCKKWSALYDDGSCQVCHRKDLEDRKGEGKG